MKCEIVNWTNFENILSYQSRIPTDYSKKNAPTFFEAKSLKILSQQTIYGKVSFHVESDVIREDIKQSMEK